MNFFQLLPIEQWHSTWYTSYEISCWWKLLNKFQVSEKDFLSKAAPILCFQIFLGFYIWEIEKNRKDRERTFEICGFCELQRLPLLLSKFPQSQWRFFFFIWNPEKILLPERCCAQYILFCEVIFWASSNYIMRKSLSTVTRVQWNGVTLS